MGPNKAPGPDGFTVGFYYQTHWDLVGSSVTGAVLNFLKREIHRRSTKLA